MSINRVFGGILRSYPVIMMYSTIIMYILSSDLDFLYLLLVLLVGEGINYNLKYNFFKPIFGKDIPLLGRGARPKGAKQCGLFITTKEKKLTSYGMPSGHSQNSALFLVFLILKILSENKLDSHSILKILFLAFWSFSVMISRWIFNCHTIGQILVGGSLGSIIGYSAFKYKDLLLNNL